MPIKVVLRLKTVKKMPLFFDFIDSEKNTAFKTQKCHILVAAWNGISIFNNIWHA